MSNMSYCRFRNTLPDLRDCAANITEAELSSDEQEERAALVACACDLLDALGIEVNLGELTVEEHIISAVQG